MSYVRRRIVSSALKSNYQLTDEALNVLERQENPLETLHRTIKLLERNIQQSLVIEKQDVLLVLNESEKHMTQHPVVTRSIEGPARVSSIDEKRLHSVERDMEILNPFDENAKITGTAEEFRKHFYSRYMKIRKILEERHATFLPISEVIALKEWEEASVAVMVYEKRDTKKAVTLEIEDPSTRVSVVALRTNRDVIGKAEMVLPDQVVGLRLRRLKDFLAVQDVIQPDIAERATRRASVSPVAVCLISDLQIGSQKFREDLFLNFTEWLRGRRNNSDSGLASRIRYLLIAGDLVDGVGIYPNQETELVIRSVREQMEKAATLLARVPSHIEVIMSPGNHDPVRKALPQPSLPESYRKILLSKKKEISFVPNPAHVQIYRRKFLIYHGQGLHDVIQALPGVSYGTLGDSVGGVMEALIRSRHLAPHFGENTLVLPLEDDPLVIEEVPDVLHTGDLHVAGYKRYKSVVMANSGCWQDQTDYQLSIGLVPTPGTAVVVELDTLNTRILPFT